MMRWSPYRIRVILHHHVSTEPFPESGAPSYIQTIDQLVTDGILQKDQDNFWVTTDLGKALVGLWCETPLPIVRYADPRFD